MAFGTVSPDRADMLAQRGTCLLYGPGERIVLPDRLEGWRFFLLQGEADLQLGTHFCEGAGTSRHGRADIIRYITDQLTMRIGPYAELAVAHTARATADLNDLCAKVALEIPDEGSRTEFLQAVQVGKTSTYGPGFQFAARRDAARIARGVACLAKSL